MRAYSHPLSPALCGDLLLGKRLFQKLTDNHLRPKVQALRSLETNMRLGRATERCYMLNIVVVYSNIHPGIAALFAKQG